mgnify:CR=1 FL=1
MSLYEHHETGLRFTSTDLELFAAASHDRNPLHLSASYARLTPYGEPVVYGILGMLASVARLAEQGAIELVHVSAEFRNPMFAGIDYSVDVEDRGAGEAVLRIRDGARVAQVASVTYRRRPATARAAGAPDEGRHRPEAVVRDRNGLAPGTTVEGTYSTSRTAVRALLERIGIDPRSLPGAQVEALLWSSYLVGMELPGQQATFWKVDLELGSDDTAVHLSPMRYRAAVSKFEDRLDIVTVDASLLDDQATVATGVFQAFVRPPSPQPSVDRLQELVPGGEPLRGITAVVTGASRGLGAAITQALALAGAEVLANYRHSADRAERVRDDLGPLRDRIELLPGDAASAAWCRELEPHLDRRGGPDLLICNASPAIRPLDFHPDGVSRLQSFVSESVALVASPLAVCARGLQERNGRVLVVSSSALENPPAEWPHYITAKAAIEGLTEWAAVRYRDVEFVLARPPKLLTDQMNTPISRRGAAPIEVVAGEIVTALSSGDLGAATTANLRRI